jgi:predicted KAP-like P-loop ATPase
MKPEELINKIAQDKIDFNIGLDILLKDDQYSFDKLFNTLKNYIINAIPNKENYNSESYQKAIVTIPLRPTYTPIVILKTYPTKIAFNKLILLPKKENEKISYKLQTKNAAYFFIPK